MSEIGKYRPADFVGAALNYPLTAADIEFFRVNLQNSNCISYCAIGPRHQIDQAVETILKTICMMGGEGGRGSHWDIIHLRIKHHCHILSMAQKKHQMNEIRDYSIKNINPKRNLPKNPGRQYRLTLMKI